MPRPTATLIINVGFEGRREGGRQAGCQAQAARRCATRHRQSAAHRRRHGRPLTITEVDEASAVGKFSGAGKPQVERHRVDQQVGGCHGSANRFDRGRLPGHRHSGRRRHGQGVQGPQCDFRPHRGHEGAAAGPGRRSRNWPTVSCAKSKCRPAWSIPISPRCTPPCGWKISS